MAISPQILKKNTEQEVDTFEKEIDAMLTKEKLYGTSLSITPPKGMTIAHYQIMKPRYISAGWKDVRWTDSQRDGKTITFSTVEPCTDYR